MPKKAAVVEPKPGVRPTGAPVDVPYYSDIPVLAEASELETLVSARQQANKNIDLLTAEIENHLNPQILNLLTIAKVDSVGVDHWKVTRAKGRKSKSLTGLALIAEDVDVEKIAKAATKVDRDALLGLGVSIIAIQKATAETPGEPYLVVTDARKEKKGEK